MIHTIKEVAEQLEMSQHTIRYYTDMGLVPSIKRDENNHRVFDERAINWLKGLKYLKGCGMSIKALQQYVDLCMSGESTVQERYEIIDHQKEEIDKKLKELQQCSQYLADKKIYYQKVMAGEIIDRSNPNNW